MHFSASRDLAPFVAEKGSITIDGVSLTINAVTDGTNKVCFSVNLVPHTLGVTSLGSLNAGDGVHLEVDLVARYVKRILDAGRHLDAA